MLSQLRMVLIWIQTLHLGTVWFLGLLCPEYNCRIFLQCNLCMKRVVCASLKVYFGYFRPKSLYCAEESCRLVRRRVQSVLTKLGSHKANYRWQLLLLPCTPGVPEELGQLPVHRTQLPDSVSLPDIPPGAAPSIPSHLGWQGLPVRLWAALPGNHPDSAQTPPVVLWGCEGCPCLTTNVHNLFPGWSLTDHSWQKITEGRKI